MWFYSKTLRTLHPLQESLYSMHSIFTFVFGVSIPDFKTSRNLFAKKGERNRYFCVETLLLICYNITSLLPNSRTVYKHPIPCFFLFSNFAFWYTVRPCLLFFTSYKLSQSLFLSFSPSFSPSLPLSFCQSTVIHVEAYK